MLFFISTLPGELFFHSETDHVESKKDFFYLKYIALKY